MRELRNLSKLPANPEYWERLEARMLGGRAAGWQGGNGSGWWIPLATRAGALSGLAAAAGIAALLLVPPRTRGEAPSSVVLFRLPDDPAMNAFLSSPAPPSVGSLLVLPLRSAP